MVNAMDKHTDMFLSFRSYNLQLRLKNLSLGLNTYFLWFCRICRVDKLQVFVFGTILVSTIDKPARLTIRVLWFSFLISDLSDQKLKNGDTVYSTRLNHSQGAASKCSGHCWEQNVFSRFSCRGEMAAITIRACRAVNPPFLTLPAT